MIKIDNLTVNGEEAELTQYTKTEALENALEEAKEYADSQRIAYEEGGKEIAFGDPSDYAGNKSVEMDMMYSAYFVSDMILTKDELLNSTVEITYNIGTETYTPLQVEDLTGDAYGCGYGAVFEYQSYGVPVPAIAVLTQASGSRPAGTYISFGLLQKLHGMEPNVESGKIIAPGTVHKIDPKYLPDDINVDLDGYATETFVEEYAQPKGDYMTSAGVESYVSMWASGYVATETYVQNYAQPKGDYPSRTDVNFMIATSEHATKAELNELSDKVDNLDIPASPNATAIDMVRENDTVTATITLDDGSVSTSVITVDANDYPIKIVADGIECPITWTGFSGETGEELISFTVAGVELKSEKDMTWGEWVDSEYNTYVTSSGSKLAINPDTSDVCYLQTNGIYGMTIAHPTNYNYAKADDVIVAGTQYIEYV